MVKIICIYIEVVLLVTHLMEYLILQANAIHSILVELNHQHPHSCHNHNNIHFNGIKRWNQYPTRCIHNLSGSTKMLGKEWYYGNLGPCIWIYWAKLFYLLPDWREVGQQIGFGGKCLDCCWRTFLQTRCSRDCSINSVVSQKLTNELINFLWNLCNDLMSSPFKIGI